MRRLVYTSQHEKKNYGTRTRKPQFILRERNTFASKNKLLNYVKRKKRNHLGKIFICTKIINNLLRFYYESIFYVFLSHISHLSHFHISHIFTFSHFSHFYIFTFLTFLHSHISHIFTFSHSYYLTFLTF
jgi:hypothetical protein